MRYISANEIENIVEKVLSQADVDSLPIRADSIAEFTFDLEIEWKNLDKCSNIGDVLAALSIRDKKIYMNESHEWELKNNSGRMNFTVAHELGHWFIPPSLDLWHNWLDKYCSIKTHYCSK